MIFRRNLGRAYQIILARQQGNDVAGTGRGDGFVEPRQRTHMDHQTVLFGARPQAVETSVLRQLRETLEKSPLRRFRRPWGEIIPLGCGGQGWAWTEKSSRLSGAEARKYRRLQECGAAIGGLDDGDDFSRQLARQSKTDMDRIKQAMFHGFVGAADHNLER